jgi:hypothetical protein
MPLLQVRVQYIITMDIFFYAEHFVSSMTYYYYVFFPGL